MKLNKELVKVLIKNAKKVLSLKDAEDYYYVKPHYVVKVTEKDIEKLKKNPLVLCLNECSVIFWYENDNSRRT